MTSAAKAPGKLWCISELYYPEDSATGYFMAGIAEGVARNRPVGVICGQPTYDERGTRAPRQEEHNGVDIHRCWSTTFDRHRIVLRMFNIATISISLFFKALFRVRKGDLALVVTNPPLLPFLTLFACRIRRAQCILLIHDVYPEVFVATGLFKKKSLVVRMIQRLSQWLYRRMNHIVVLGRDMKELVEDKLRDDGSKIDVIENWGDVENIVPLTREENSLLQQIHAEDRFVVQYGGNIGRTHGIETLLEAARDLKDHDDVLFLVIGEGAKRRWLVETAKEESLTNIVVLPRQPRDQLPISLCACDVSIIPFVAGMIGVSVPSRMYNMLAAGRPIIAVAEEQSELALVIREEQAGWVVPPGDAQALVATILEAKKDVPSVHQKGIAARRAAEEKYSYRCIASRYDELLEKLDPTGRS